MILSALLLLRPALCLSGAVLLAQVGACPAGERHLAATWLAGCLCAACSVCGTVGGLPPAWQAGSAAATFGSLAPWLGSLLWAGELFRCLWRGAAPGCALPAERRPAAPGLPLVTVALGLSRPRHGPARGSVAPFRAPSDGTQQRSWFRPRAGRRCAPGMAMPAVAGGPRLPRGSRHPRRLLAMGLAVLLPGVAGAADILRPAGPPPEASAVLASPAGMLLLDLVLLGSPALLLLLRRKPGVGLLPAARAALFDIVPDPVLVLDATGRITRANAAALSLPGLPSRGEPAVLDRPAATLPVWGAHLAAALAGNTCVIAEAGLRYEVHVVPLAGPGRRLHTWTGRRPGSVPAGHLLLLRDVTERDGAEARLRAALATREAQLADSARIQAALHQEARHDALTQVRNRRALEEELPPMIAEARRTLQPISAVMIDLDHFKQLNDTHGHAAGDAVLRRTAAQIGQALRATDRVFRLGGEEFLVVLPNTFPAEAQVPVERWRRELAEGVFVDGQRLEVTFSAGIASVPGAADDAAALLARADEALYEAKRLGRDRTCLATPPLAVE